MNFKHRRAVIGAVLATFLASCSVVDQYSSRAIDYNIEAEEADNQALLLNVVRASLHRPMQFTDVQNIVGSTTATGGLSLGFPIGPHPSTSITTGGASGTLAGGTTFTIPVLNTQEFYQGLLNPVQPQLIDYLFKVPNQRRLIFNMLFERITVRVESTACKKSHLARCERDFRNNPSSDVDIALFQAFANYLLGLGFSTESVDTPKKKFAQEKGVTTVVNVSNSATAGPDDKPDRHVRLCFNTRSSGNSAYVANEQCGSDKKLKASGNTDSVDRLDGIGFTSSLATDMLGIIEGTEDPGSPYIGETYKASIPSFSGQVVSVTLQTRSTYDIFRYLGDLIGRPSGGRRILLSPGDPQYRNYPCWVQRDQHGCKPIIAVDSPGVSAGSLAFVAYAGTSYSMPGDPSLTFDPEVLSVLKELIALNVSAKSLPTTAILNLSGAQ